ncbi:hypothetical protein L1987_13243 [Smallanthus sonchifolius]|uniref:Uncharacterized protein n=1 Tax=Smallanthus sonchifolius TaxID=185202 RepID=A0ACB9JGT9_9ASTR|nr:hypothetical protein L1987_13243 [Smallanthus sonchifolius]
MRGGGFQSERGYRRRGADEALWKDVITFFVSNLPEDCSGSLLWKAFQPTGRVKDAYVARKKDARKNTFGFVRIEGIHDVEEVLEKMNNIKIMAAKLDVSLARYDRFHRKMQQKVYSKPHRGDGPRSKSSFEQSVRFEHQSAYGPNGVSFRDAVAECSSGVKSVVVEDPGSLYAKHCMGRSAFGVALGVQELCNTRKMLVHGGFLDTSISYVGGLKVLMTFKDQKEATQFLNSDGWRTYFESMVIWNGEDMPFDRIIGLTVTGVSLKLRDSSVFSKVGELFGKNVWPAEFSWEGVDNSYGVCYVLSSSGKRIEEEIILSCNGVSYLVWVSEELTSWAPSFSDAMSPPVGKVPDQVSSEESDKEDGEIKEPSSKNKERHDRNSGPEVENEDEVEGSPRVSWGMHEAESVHGEGTPGTCVEVGPPAELYGGWNNVFPLNLNLHGANSIIGPNVVVAHLSPSCSPPPALLKKRSRQTRSPWSVSPQAQRSGESGVNSQPMVSTRLGWNGSKTLRRLGLSPKLSWIPELS